VTVDNKFTIYYRTRKSEFQQADSVWVNYELTHMPYEV